MERKCPLCGKVSDTYKGYSLHFNKSGDHVGNALLELIGEGELKELYFNNTYEEISNELGIGSTTLKNNIDDLNFPKKTEFNRIEHQYAVPLEWLFDTLHNTLGKSVNQMSKELDIARHSLSGKMDELGVHRRGRSEAEQLKWNQMTEDGRRQQVEAAHQKTREKFENGNGSFQVWREENPEEAREMVIKAAGKGAEAREENGMKDVTGEDHPAWRGGKSIYDAVKKQLGDESWHTTRMKARSDADYECQMCGETAEESGRGLDVHHIIPIMCGGTNDNGWNTMVLCMSCHHKAEWYCRNEIPELEPVLTE